MLRDAAPRPEAKTIFEAIIAAAVALAKKLIHPLHDGAFSRYGAIMAMTVIVAGTYAWMTGTIGEMTRALQPAGPVPIAGWTMLVAATAALVFLHRNRLLSLNEGTETSYVDSDNVKSEIQFARRMFADNGWRALAKCFLSDTGR